MIEYGVIVGPNYQDYLRLFLKTANQTSNINWTICLDSDCNENNFKEFNQYKFTKFTTNEEKDLKSLGHRHAEMIEHFINQSTQDFVCFFDADIVFLKEDWNIQLVDKLADDVIAIGTESTAETNWRNFPNGTGMLLNKTLYKQIGATFKKSQYGIENPFITVTNENQKLWEKPIGTKIYCEIGIDLVIKSYENNLKGISIPCLYKYKNSQFFGWNDVLFSHCTNSRYGGLTSNQAIRWLSKLRNDFPNIV